MWRFWALGISCTPLESLQVPSTKALYRYFSKAKFDVKDLYRTKMKNQIENTYWGPNGLLYAWYGLRMLYPQRISLASSYLTSFSAANWARGKLTTAAGVLPWWPKDVVDIVGAGSAICEGWAMVVRSEVAVRWETSWCCLRAKLWGGLGTNHVARDFAGVSTWAGWVDFRTTCRFVFD